MADTILSYCKAILARVGLKNLSGSEAKARLPPPSWGINTWITPGWREGRGKWLGFTRDLTQLDDSTKQDRRKQAA